MSSDEAGYIITTIVVVMMLAAYLWNRRATSVTPDEHSKYLGQLVSNLQSLELLLRLFLHKLPGAAPIGIPYGTDIYSFPVGNEVPLSDITSYDTLGTLLGKFNAEMNKSGLQNVDRGLVDIRDALAHGRVSSTTEGGTMRLLKFSAPAGGKLIVTFNEEMSEQWFRENIRKSAEAIRIVRAQLPP